MSNVSKRPRRVAARDKRYNESVASMGEDHVHEDQQHSYGEDEDEDHTYQQDDEVESSDEHEDQGDDDDFEFVEQRRVEGSRRTIQSSRRRRREPEDGSVGAMPAVDMAASARQGERTRFSTPDRSPGRAPEPEALPGDASGQVLQMDHTDSQTAGMMNQVQLERMFIPQSLDDHIAIGNHVLASIDQYSEHNLPPIMSRIYNPYPPPTFLPLTRHGQQVPAPFGDGHHLSDIPWLPETISLATKPWKMAVYAACGATSEEIARRVPRAEIGSAPFNQLNRRIQKRIDDFNKGKGRLGFVENRGIMHEAKPTKFLTTALEGRQRHGDLGLKLNTPWHINRRTGMLQQPGKQGTARLQVNAQYSPFLELIAKMAEVPNYVWEIMSDDQLRQHYPAFFHAYHRAMGTAVANSSNSLPTVPPRTNNEVNRLTGTFGQPADARYRLQEESVCEYGCPMHCPPRDDRDQANSLSPRDRGDEQLSRLDPDGPYTRAYTRDNEMAVGLGLASLTTGSRHGSDGDLYRSLWQQDPAAQASWDNMVIGEQLDDRSWPMDQPFGRPTITRGESRRGEPRNS